MKTFFVLIQVFLVILLGSFTLFTVKSVKVQTIKSNVKVTGTSTIHDWEMKVTKMDGSLDLETNNKEIVNISNLKLVFYTNGIISGKDGMDEKAYGALKEKKFPTITFEMTNLLSNKQLNGVHQIKASGNLSIAGVTKEIIVIAYCQINSADELEIKGMQNIDMKEYNIDPPTALLGTVTSGKDVVLKYNLTLK